MFATVLRGQVSHEDWTHLEQQYQLMLKSVPHELVESFLMQDHTHPTQWLIITIWKSENDYVTARKEKKTEACEDLFCAAGSVPERSFHHIKRGYFRV
ncbi:MAG: hypothetical protein HY835_03755 [Anaerolineae bacterium]|nr:hypothetical protein [Anaerolineae bacterium]